MPTNDPRIHLTQQQSLQGEAPQATSKPTFFTDNPATASIIPTQLGDRDLTASQQRNERAWILSNENFPKMNKPPSAVQDGLPADQPLPVSILPAWAQTPRPDYEGLSDLLRRSGLYHIAMRSCEALAQDSDDGKRRTRVVLFHVAKLEHGKLLHSAFHPRLDRDQGMGGSTQKTETCRICATKR